MFWVPCTCFEKFEMPRVFSDLCGIGFLNMPLLLTTHPFENATFGLWHIAEDEQFFRADLPLSGEEEQEFLRHRNPLRRLEWLAGRWLLHKLTDTPQRLFLAKDAFSKPFFRDNQQLACSLSHSRGAVGALVVESPEPAAAAPRSIGCDIQVLTEKMPRIAPKFLNAGERTFLSSRSESEHFDLLHLIWTAKESLFKAYGLKELDFRKNLSVQQIEWDGHAGSCVGKVEKGNYQGQFHLIFTKIELPNGFYLMVAVCKEDGSK